MSNLLEQINLAALLAVYVPLCAGIIVACICRLDAMNARRHQARWNVMYVLFAAYAGGELTDVLRLQIWMSTHELLGLLGIAANLALTNKHWRQGPPPITCKPCREGGEGRV